MNAAAPEGAPPRRINNMKHFRKTPNFPTVPRRGPEAGSPHICNFLGLGVNFSFIPVSTEQNFLFGWFLKSEKYPDGIKKCSREQSLVYQIPSLMFLPAYTGKSMGVRLKILSYC